tara:strand:+ start:20860 stop:22125 length:1266 start_codon:yes stop_codon:yes gene_type:complete
MKRIVLLFALALFAFPISSAEAGRNLNNLSLTVRNIEATGAIEAKYYDGVRVHLGRSSDATYIENHLVELQRGLQRCSRLWASLSAEEQHSKEGKKVGATLQKWVEYHDTLRDALNLSVRFTKEAEAKCRNFATEVMGDKDVAASMYNLMNPSVPLLATRFASVRQHAQTVAAACALPKFEKVGVGSCPAMKVNGPQRDPSLWCKAASNWKAILTANVNAQVNERVESFKNRPLLRDKLKGDQHIGFFVKSVPNKGGWRSHYRIADMIFPKEAQAKYINEANQMYEALGLDKRVTPATFDSIPTALAELRASAEASGGAFDMPKSYGNDYGVKLAKKQLKGLGYKAKFVKAFSGSKDFSIRKNNLGVPLDRAKAGYMLVKPDGQTLCTLISYTLTETYRGGGKYQKAKGVHYNDGRFQSCR